MTEKIPGDTGFDLSLLTTEDILSELQKRHDVMLFVGYTRTVKKPADDGGKCGNVVERYEGSGFEVLGLLTWVRELKLAGIHIGGDEDEEEVT